MKFIENIVTEKVAERAARIFLRSEFSWFYNGGTSKIIPGNNTVLVDDNTKESIQFTHKLFTEGSFDSEYVDIVMKIMRGLEEKEGIVCKEMYRAKCNLLPQDPSYGVEYYHPPHVDVANPNDNMYSLVYYVNDSDGDTIVFNEKVGEEFTGVTIAHRQTPKQGCALLFKSGTYHASTSPMITKSRVVINIVFEADETTVG
jgi:hypothetical protein